MESPYFEKYGRFWAVYDGADLLVCVAVYRKGAREVVRRLTPPAEGPSAFPPSPNGCVTAATTQRIQLPERALARERKHNYG
jgi:hypothetical protein